MFSEAISNVVSQLNVVPQADKLTIIPMSEIGPVPVPSGLPYVTQFAPEKYDTMEQQTVLRLLMAGNHEPESQYGGSQGEDFSFEVVIDATGAGGSKRDVDSDLSALQSATGYNGSLHQINFLTIVWGKFIRTAVLRGLTVKYTLFKPDGTPLRATVTLQFRKHVPRLISLLQARLSSPDLTQERIVRRGDRLDLLCQRHYRDQRHYLSVAQANNLTSFRFLAEGAELVLPPIAK